MTARETYVWIGPGKIVRKEDAPVRRGKGPMVISDQLDYVVNPADGKRYDSKRAYEKAVRAKGCVIVGNESQDHLARNKSKPPPVRPDLIRTWESMERKN